jgi:anti-sigma regulatory factor (Ser/Thr protein kinase)
VTPAENVSIRLALPARPENLGVIRQALTGLADASSINGELLGDMKMAVTEACTNVILHAYEEPGSVDVEIISVPESITIVVRDFGIGFLPRPTSPNQASRRLGLPLMAALTDRFEIGNNDRGSGTQVTMLFSLAPD